MRIRILMLSLLIGLSLTAAGAGNAVPTPTALEGGKIVTVAEAKTLQEAGAVFIDTRNPLNFGRGHVPGAIHIGYKNKSRKAVGFDASKDSFDMSRLPADKAGALVIYSHGDTGWKSYKAAVLAIRAGYTSVHWMRDGWSVWTDRGYPVEN